jgi:succinyl-CoA synthetase beta subunit
MARLHEYEGKRLLKEQGIAVPMGQAVKTPEDAERVAAEIGGAVVLKVQAWITGRKSKGGVLFADTPAEAKVAAEQLLDMSFGNFPVEELLVEQLLDITHELFH